MALKKSTFFFLFFLGLTQLVVSQENDALLIQADSLFEEQKYTESYEVYESIYEGKEQFSSQMLLKMAYIKEGLGDYSKALYFLENYYRKTNDSKALVKIKEIVEQEQALGYEYNDFTYGLNYLVKYNEFIIVGLILICMLLSGHVVWAKYKKQLLARVSLVLLLASACALIFLLNVDLGAKEGVIVGNNAFAMREPSAAANIAEVLDKGDKVQIEKRGEIWTKVIVAEKELYIRSNKIGFLL